MEIRRHIVLSLAVAMMLSACSKNEIPSSGEASLSFSLSADRTANEVTLSKSGESKAGEILSEDFMFHIENAPRPGNKPDTVYGPVRYADVPTVLRYVPGAYRIVATHGGSAKMPAFDSPIYRAEEKITIAQGENKSIALNAILATTKMSVKFDDSFATYYAGYSVDIRTVEDEFLTFGADETREGYFTPGNIRMRFNLVTKDGKELTYSPPASITSSPTKAKEFYKLNLSVSSNKGSGSIGISTDGSTNDKSISVEIPAYMLPKAPPLATPSGFESEVPVQTNQWMFTDQSVSIRTTAGLKSVIVKTTAPDALAAGWPVEGVNLVGLSTDMRDKLRALGLKWSDQLNTIEGAANLTTDAYVTLSGLTGNMTTPANTTSTQDFSVEAIDKFGQSTGVYTLRLEIAPPVFALKRIDGDPNIWATKAEWTTEYTTQIQGVSPKIQYRFEGGAWQDANVEVIDSNSEAGTITHRIKGLKTGSLYSYRAIFGTHASAEVAVLTEMPNQVPNSGMEDWNRWTVGSALATKVNVYQPCATHNDENRWWDTNNARTTAYGAGGMSGVCNTYNSFPAVSYIYTGRTGKAAELRSISASGSGVNSSTACASSNRTPGRLFLGTYSHPGGDGDTFNYGRPFTTRPTSLTFYYQYEPWGQDNRTGGDDEFEALIEVYSGDIRIGRSEFRYRTSNRESITQWTKATTDVVYNRSDLKATSITIAFRSSVNDQPAVSSDWERNGSKYVSGKSGNDYGNGCPKIADQEYSSKQWQYYGSVLRIDDIELVY